MTIHDFTLFHKFYHVIEGNRFRHNHNKKLGPPPRFFYLFFVGIGVGGLFRRFVLLGRFFWCVRLLFLFWSFLASPPLEVLVLPHPTTGSSSSFFSWSFLASPPLEVLVLPHPTQVLLPIQMGLRRRRFPWIQHLP